MSALKHEMQAKKNAEHSFLPKTSNGVKCVTDISDAELKGRRVLVRAGLDVPLDSQGVVSDLFRVRRAIPTIQYLSERGAKVVLLSHIGRNPEQTNAPVAQALKAYVPVFYVPDLLGAEAQEATCALKDGEVVLLENLRKHYDLEKAGDEEFAKKLAALGDMYVNDAFSNSHRDHASMVALPKLLPAYAGLLLRDELAALKEALNPPRPAFAIVGGAKFETKDPVIRTFLEKYEHVAAVGAIANDVLRAKGYAVGRSKVSEHAPASEIVSNPKLVAPVDAVCETSEGQAYTKAVGDVGADDKIVDIGPDTVALMAPIIEEAKFILWNGPTGLYEEGYTDWSNALAELISKSDAKKIIGGGDTIAVLEKSGVALEDLGFLSTGGGAMLEYLLKGTLPAIEALG